MDMLACGQDGRLLAAEPIYRHGLLVCVLCFIGSMNLLFQLYAGLNNRKCGNITK